MWSEMIFASYKRNLKDELAETQFESDYTLITTSPESLRPVKWTDLDNSALNPYT